MTRPSRRTYGKPCGTSDAGGDATTKGSHVDDLAKLAELRDRGAITDEEYQRAKTKLLV